MARDISTGFITQIEAPRTKLFRLVEADFPSGWVGMFTGLGELVYNGQTYLGGGSLLQFSEVKETQEVLPTNKTVTLTGLDSALLAIALGEEWQGVSITCHEGVMDESGNTYVTPLYRGKIDNMILSNDGATGTITISIENDDYILDKSVGAYYTDADQKSRYPDDKGLDQVALIEDKQITFGRT